MRKIKFKAWDKLEKRMILPEQAYQGHYVLSLDGRFYNLQNGSGGDDYVVLQCIGLQDKNGEDIYEGDIVKHWIDLGPGGEREIIDQVTIDGWGCNLQQWTYMEKLLPEVVGNIFENENLLK